MFLGGNRHTYFTLNEWTLYAVITVPCCRKTKISLLTIFGEFLSHTHFFLLLLGEALWVSEFVTEVTCENCLVKSCNRSILQMKAHQSFNVNWFWQTKYCANIILLFTSHNTALPNFPCRKVSLWTKIHYFFVKYLVLLIAASASWTATSHFAFAFGVTWNAAANLRSRFFVYQKQILCMRFEVLTFVTMKITGPVGVWHCILL